MQGLVGVTFAVRGAGHAELVLWRPQPARPRQRARRKGFDDKTWNPIALAGDLLLVRNDREAACYRVAVR